MPPVILLLLLSIVVGFLGRNRAGGFIGFFTASMIFTPLVATLFLILARSRANETHASA
jgi:hypothetical protein